MIGLAGYGTSPVSRSVWSGEQTPRRLVSVVILHPEHTGLHNLM